MTDLDVSEVWDILEIMMNERYGQPAVDFMLEWEQGNADSAFPGSHDLSVLASSLSDWDEDFREHEIM